MKQVYQKKLLINYGQQMKVMITIHIWYIKKVKGT